MDAGRAGERAAEKEARRRGMTVLERNLGTNEFRNPPLPTSKFGDAR